jgi:hypothetical protein
VTPKKLICAEFREIPAIEITCKCGGIISIPLPHNVLPSTDLRCPGCYEDFWKSDYAFKVVRTLIGALSEWKKLDDQQLRIGFSIPDELG